MPTDRRAAIEAALDNLNEDGDTQVVEKPANTVPLTPPEDKPKELGAGETVNEEVGEPKPGAAPAAPVKPTAIAAPVAPAAQPGDKTYPVDKAPLSWRQPQKDKWAALDPDVRQEVVRREREVDRVLTESATARQIAGSFYNVVQPYMARIQSHNLHPVQAAAELFKADHILSSAPPRQRAEYMAQLIKTYGIDVRELDNVLSGQAPDPDQAVSGTVDRLLQERLKPFMDFIGQQRQSAEESNRLAAEKMRTDIEAMSSDPVKYPEFDNVREDMADVIDLSSKKGVYLTLEQAYSRAIAMNPEVNQRVQQSTERAKRTEAARAANAKAQQALKASKSVSGAPNGASTGAVVVNGRRAAIEAAMDQIEGR